MSRTTSKAPNCALHDISMCFPGSVGSCGRAYRPIWLHIRGCFSSWATQFLAPRSLADVPGGTGFSVKAHAASFPAKRGRRANTVPGTVYERSARWGRTERNPQSHPIAEENIVVLRVRQKRYGALRTPMRHAGVLLEAD